MLDEAALAVSVTIRGTSCTSRSGPLATYIAARPDLVTATTRRRAGHTRGVVVANGRCLCLNVSI